MLSNVVKETYEKKKYISLPIFMELYGQQPSK
jgi:hypothetical protein